LFVTKLQYHYWQSIANTKPYATNTSSVRMMSTSYLKAGIKSSNGICFKYWASSESKTVYKNTFPQVWEKRGGKSKIWDTGEFRDLCFRLRIFRTGKSGSEIV